MPRHPPPDYIPRARRRAPKASGALLLTITDVAAQLHLSRRSIERLVARGALQAVYPVPGSLRFRPADVTAYVAALAPVVRSETRSEEVRPGAHRIGVIPMNSRAKRKADGERECT